MARRYEGKIVLVTGSAGGLGRSFAEGFAAEGATLILADRNEAGLAETADILKGRGTAASIHKVDLSVESEIHAFAAEVKAAYPQLDVLINNAGLAYGKISRGFADLTQAEWLFFFSVNTVAPLLLAEALRDHLAKGPGNIINQSSMASYVPGTAYGITKAALNAMSFGMAASFAQQSIRVNSIQPGIMETPAGKEGVPARGRHVGSAAANVHRAILGNQHRAALAAICPSIPFVSSEVETRYAPSLAARPSTSLGTNGYRWIKLARTHSSQEKIMTMEALLAKAPPFAIFRKKDALPEAGISIMRNEPISDTAAAGAARATEAGVKEGAENRLLFAGGGFSLSYAWFKSGFPLPRHSHDTDCLYYVIAGSLRMGAEKLGPGDGFFVGGGTPYTYTPGADGVEVLEFRAGGAFNIKLLANNPAFWTKALETVESEREGWKSQRPPSEVLG